MSILLGIEIGGTKLQLVLAQRDGRVHDRRRLNVDPAQGAAGIRRQIEHALPGLLSGRAASPQAAVATGVGFGGPVDWRTGRICRSHQIEGWSEFDLATWLSELTAGPVVVDNDANVAALGEAVCGAGAGFDPVFYVTLGSGVGGGLVSNGQIYHGFTPGEAEVGHVRLDRNGTTVESRCSGWAVDARIRQLNESEPDGALCRLSRDSLGGEARHLPEALRLGDSAAQRLLDDIVSDLAFGLSHVAHLFHPQVIILGGGLSELGESLRAGVERNLRKMVMDAFAPGVRVALSALKEDAVPAGALELARRFALNQPRS